MNASANDTVFIGHESHVSVDELWNAWTLPQLVKQWFGSDPEGMVLYAKMNVASIMIDLASIATLSRLEYNTN